MSRCAFFWEERVHSFHQILQRLHFPWKSKNQSQKAQPRCNQQFVFKNLLWGPFQREPVPREAPLAVSMNNNNNNRGCLLSARSEPGTWHALSHLILVITAETTRPLAGSWHTLSYFIPGPWHPVLRHGWFSLKSVPWNSEWPTWPPQSYSLPWAILLILSLTQISPSTPFFPSLGDFHELCLECISHPNSYPENAYSNFRAQGNDSESSMHILHAEGLYGRWGQER